MFFGVFSIFLIGAGFISAWPMLQPFLIILFGISVITLFLLIKLIKMKIWKLFIHKTSRNKIIAVMLIFVITGGIIIPLWFNSFFIVFYIDPQKLDFNNFKVSFWGGLGPSNWATYEEDLPLLMALSSVGLNSTFYSTISMNYFTNVSLHEKLINFTNNAHAFGMTFVPHTSIGDFPDDYIMHTQHLEPISR